MNIEKSPKKMPHFSVYTRLGYSKIHGIGIIAIKNIPKGTYIFCEDRSKMVEVDRSVVIKQEPEIRKFYNDFCVIKGDKYICPDNFNNLTIGWYLNDSNNPNVLCDSKYDFYAKRDIKKGEELTVKYSTFTERPDNERV